MACYKAQGFLQIASKVSAQHRPSNKSGAGIIAGRSQLRRATLSLPTHREVVAAAFRISALGAPQLKEPPAPVRFHAACLHSTPPRFDYLSSATKLRQ